MEIRIYAYTTYLGIIPGLDLAVFVTSNGPNGKNPGHIIRQLFFYIADLVLGEDTWLNTANAGAASNTTTTCDDHTFNNTFRFLGSYEHQLYGRVDITREGPHGLYARYNRLEGQLCRSEMEHVALYQVRDSAAACRGDHANDTRVVILLLAAAFFSVGMS
ncbi:hypothetical protein ACOMHN_016802 [Nucella lapillus]